MKLPGVMFLPHLPSDARRIWALRCKVRLEPFPSEILGLRLTGWRRAAWQQGSGINFITGYGVYFFTVVGIKVCTPRPFSSLHRIVTTLTRPQNAFVIQVALYLVGFPATWICQYGLEKYGRRPLLIISGLGMAVGTLTMGGLGLNHSPSYSISEGIVGLVFVYMFAFSLAWGPAVWVVCSEISTGRNRSKLMTLSTCTNWFFNWLVSFTFPYLFDADAAALDARVGFIYGSLMVFATVWVYFLLPETAQRSLEDINDLFEQGVPAKKFACKSYLWLAFESLPALHVMTVLKKQHTWSHFCQLQMRKSRPSWRLRYRKSTPSEIRKVRILCESHLIQER